jgi:hypothetical protein
MKAIRVEISIHKNLFKVWEIWTDPIHIKKWYFASDDWAVGEVENNLSVGGRRVEIHFEKISDNETRITEIFEIENENSEELQRKGWQSILENFKKYSENLYKNRLHHF